MRSRFTRVSIKVVIGLTFAAVLLGSLATPAAAQVNRTDAFKIEDLVGRWERWPEKVGDKGVRLYAYGYNDGNGHARMTINISVAEQHAFGPQKPGLQQFKGKFDPNGFDLFYDCVASEYCGNAIEEGPNRGRRLASRKDSGVIGRYRYNIRFVRSDLLLVTAYSPRYKYSGEDFVGIEQEAKVRRFYLTRNDTCEKSKDLVKREFINGEFSDRFLLALGEPKPLPVGTIIEENTPKPREIFRLSKPGCFFFLDLVPTALWSHPVVYLLVNEAEQKIIGREYAGNPPLLTIPERNGGERTEYYYEIQSRVDSPNLLFPTLDEGRDRAVKTPPIIPSDRKSLGPITADLRFDTSISRNLSSDKYLPVRYLPRSVPPDDKCVGVAAKKRALIVNGGKNKGFDAEVARYKKTFAVLGFNKIVEASWRNSTLEAVRKDIEDLSKGLGKCDVFTIYIVSHALAYLDPNYMSDGDVCFNAPFGNFSAHPWSLFNFDANTFKDTGAADTGTGLLWELRYVDAGYIHVILDECYSERLIEAAIKEDYGGTPIARFLDEGQRLALFTSSAWNETSGIVEKDLNYFYRWLVDTYLDVGTAFSQVLSEEIEEAVSNGLPDQNRDGTVDRNEYEVIARMAMTTASKKVRDATSRSKTLSTQTPKSCTIIGTLNECFR